MENEKVFVPEEFIWYDSLRRFLSIYQSAEVRDADKIFTTREIIAEIELHYAIPQGSDETFIAPNSFVQVMHQLDFEEANDGTGLVWPVIRVR